MLIVAIHWPYHGSCSSYYAYFDVNKLTHRVLTDSVRAPGPRAMLVGQMSVIYLLLLQCVVPQSPRYRMPNARPKRDQPAVQ